MDQTALAPLPCKCGHTDDTHVMGKSTKHQYCYASLSRAEMLKIDFAGGERRGYFCHCQDYEPLDQSATL
jgi:hypothetical protein